ncbi:hypothetical protein ABTM86_20110, partial [Acinetobacter baumannii]
HDPFNSDDHKALPSRLVPADIGGMRVAVSTDLGCAPIDRDIAKVFEARAKIVAGAFRDAAIATPDFGPAHETFEVHRCVYF